MNWLLFAIVGWVVLGLELSLRELLQLGPGGIAPSFMLAYMVFIAMWAPASGALGAAFLLGMLVDLTGPILIGSQTHVVAGPHALGYTLGAWLVVNARGSVMRRNPVTLVSLTVLTGVINAVVVVFLHSVRDLYDPFAWKPTGELVVALASALYSGAAAAALALPLFGIIPLFGFPSGVAHGTRASVHRA